MGHRGLAADPRQRGRLVTERYQGQPFITSRTYMRAFEQAEAERLIKYAGWPDDRTSDGVDRQFEPFRIVVCGSRTWADSWKAGAHLTRRGRLELDVLFNALDGLRLNAVDALRGNKHGVRIVAVHGGCPTGADAIAAHWAFRRDDVCCEVFPADWDAHGRAAGPIRNKQMIDSLDPGNPGHLVVAAWDGQSRGTASTIKFARDAGIPVITLGLQ